MRLSSLNIRRLPGISPAFTLEFADGVNLVSGPNGSGKSSLTRALFRLLWPDLQEPASCDLAARFEAGQRWWEAETHDGRTVQWRHQGAPAVRPGLPDQAVAPSYRLSMLDLTPPDMGRDDRELARRIRREMDGDFDLAAARAALFPAAPKAGQAEARKLAEARRQAQTIRDQYRGLAEREMGLEQKRRERSQALLAGRRVIVLKAIATQKRRSEERDELRRLLQEFPPGTALAAVGDPATLKDLRSQEADNLRVRNEAEQELSRLGQEHDQVALPAVGEGAFSLELLDSLNESLAAVDGDLDELRLQLAGLNLPQEEGPTTPPVDRRTFQALIGLHADLMSVEARRERAHAEQKQLDETSPVGTWPGWALLGVGAAAAVLGGWWLASGEAGGPGLAALGLGAVALGGGAFLLGRRDHRHFTTARRRLESELAELGARREAIVGELQALAGRHGLELDNRDLVHDLKETSTRLEAQLKQEQLRTQITGRIRQREQDRQLALRRVNEQLALAGAAAVAGREEARAARHELDRRLRLRDELAGRMRVAETARDHAAADLARVCASIDQLYRRLLLDPAADTDETVARLAAARPRWDELTRKIGEAESDIRAQAGLVAQDPGLVPAEELLALPLAAIGERLAAEQALAAEADTLVREIADLESALDTARTAEKLAEAQHAADSRREELAGKRDEARRTAVGAALLDLVRRQSESRSRPAVLSQARELFAHFTGGRYDLEVGGDEDPGAFQARDTRTGHRLDLRQLSDGTRAQLLLAVRLGFIFQTESEFQPPLFLDDSLGSSDPRRFAAVAGSLGQLAQDHHRQIIFLTPDPADVPAWQAALTGRGLPPAHVIDLAAQRRLAGQAKVEQLQAPSPPPVPDPTGLSAVQYARALGVPVLDPWAEPGDAHLFYLLDDRLDLLHKLVVAGHARLGPWVNRRAALLTAGTLTADEDDMLALRAEVWRATQEAWRRGRGRPLTMIEVEGSGVVTGANRERLAEVLDACGGNPARFMTAVREGGVARFRGDKKDQLQEYLELEGFLDSRPVLDGEGLIRQVLPAVAHHLGAGRLGQTEVRSQVQALAAYLDKYRPGPA